VGAFRLKWRRARRPQCRVDWALLQRHCQALQPLAVLDTLKLSRPLFRELSRHGLNELVTVLDVNVPPMGGVGRVRNHSAL
jgi:DNA polymerase III alpha subunit (gram-positive type)